MARQGSPPLQQIKTPVRTTQYKCVFIFDFSVISTNFCRHRSRRRTVKHKVLKGWRVTFFQSCSCHLLSMELVFKQNFEVKFRVKLKTFKKLQNYKGSCIVIV